MDQKRVSSDMEREVKFNPGTMTYKEAKRYAYNGLLRVSPDDLIVLLEMAEEHGARELLEDTDVDLG